MTGTSMRYSVNLHPCVIHTLPRLGLGPDHRARLIFGRPPIGPRSSGQMAPANCQGQVRLAYFLGTRQSSIKNGVSRWPIQVGSDRQASTVAALFQGLTTPFDKPGVRLHTMDVGGPAPRARLPRSRCHVVGPKFGMSQLAGMSY